MNQVNTTAKVNDGGNAREILERPFPAEVVKTRPASYGAALRYVEGCEYIKRLNEAFDGQWSFEVVKHEIGENEVFVVGKLVAGDVVKMAFGGSDIKRKKETGEIICIADDLKSAATDALKKSASLLGLGLHLYGGDSANNGKPTNGDNAAKPADAAPANGNGANDVPATSKQLRYAKTLADDRGMTLDSLKAMAHTRYGCALDAITRRQASALIEDLRFA